MPVYVYAVPVRGIPPDRPDSDLVKILGVFHIRVVNPGNKANGAEEVNRYVIRFSSFILN